MTSKVLELDDLLSPDREATLIIEEYIGLENKRNQWRQEKEEIRKYVYATDTSQTSNSRLPWKNKTTTPKLCQIRDNLYSNYTATLFPQRKWLVWEANERDSNSKRKRDAIVNYMSWAITQPAFKHEIDKCILDYIDYGNCFATVEWMDQRQTLPDGTSKGGYVGPVIRRIDPLMLNMNPTAENFQETPKFIKSITSVGELKERLERMSNDENREEYEALWKYLTGIRSTARDYTGDFQSQHNMYYMEGFSDFRDYLASDFVEVITFYGDLYDRESQTLWKNHVITVVDRHKVIGKKPNPSYFGYPPIFHVPWRKRQDNLWGMGPLDNLVGLQYRLDHIENMKADIMDLVTFPVQKVKGFVEDYTWAPGEKIFVSEEGDVELVVPEVNALSANFEIERIQRTMEEMAGAPREAMGFRTPGEKTKYEVQSLENAASRVFQNKIRQFEEMFVEPLLNAMLELARRNLTGVNTIKVMDDQFKLASFQDLTVEDITGIGRIKPVAARHFTEQAQLIQNISGMAQSPVWPFVQSHFSSVKLAKIYENIFGLEEYEVVVPFVALSEQAEGQKLSQSLQENVLQHTMTASGIGEDFDLNPEELQVQ